MDRFVISDLEKEESNRFYQQITFDKYGCEKHTHSRKVSIEMKTDMKMAFVRFFGKDKGVTFDSSSTQGTLVDGIHRGNDREDYNKDLCLRIDLQGINKGKEKGVVDKKLANVQIQLNKSCKWFKEKVPSTIAQVHFECGKEIPKDRVIEAFERSWKDMKAIYVYIP